MLNYDHRPQQFNELVGANTSKAVLSSIAKNPENAPRAIVLEGGYGCGKTTAARIFGRAVNCVKRDGDCCGNCDNCKEISKGSPLYSELDSAIVGDVNSMRENRDAFAYSVVQGIRVVVIDEIHLCSRQSQSTLLAVLEEAPKNIFFLMVSTDLERILDTILSRSLILSFPALNDDEIMSLLRSVASKEGMEIADTTLFLIARRVNGHARDSLQQLEEIKLIGEGKYVESTVLLDDLFDNMFEELRKQDFNKFKIIATDICQNPVRYISQDFSKYMMRLADRVFIDGDSQDKREKEVVALYLKNHKFLSKTEDFYLFFMLLTSFYRKKVISQQGRFTR